MRLSAYLKISHCWAPNTVAPVLNELGNVLRALGYICLVPASLLAALLIAGIAVYGFADGFSIPFRARWSLAMSVSMVVFQFASLAISNTPARMLMYASGGMTVFSAIVCDAFNAAEFAAYTGSCGNPVIAGLLFRLACFSTYFGVPLVALPGLVCLRRPKRDSET